MYLRLEFGAKNLNEWAKLETFFEISFLTLKIHSHKFTLEASKKKFKGLFHEYQRMHAFIYLILNVSVLNVFYR